jgi:predicted lipoprotein with Yx(FWY)xxD motif
MNKKVTGLVVAIVIVALGVGGYFLFHKSSTTSGYSLNTTSNNNAPSSSQQSSGAVVQTKTSSSVGSYLADANGDALYTYGADTSGTSNCSGSCLYSWPIYAADNAPATLPANVTVITRGDGSKQYAYKGMPLYTFSSDSAGQVTGDNVSNFHVAKP